MRLFIKKNILRIGLINITLLVSSGLKACESQCLLKGDDFVRLLPIDFCILMQRFNGLINEDYKNVLILGGDPGTGKSTLAREFAKQTESLSIIVSTSNVFSSGIMGSGSKAVNEAFDQAQTHINNTHQKVVIIFEEIDAIAAPMRDTSDGNAKRAYQTSNVLVDEHKENKKLFIIGTTNRFELCAKEFKDRCEYIHIDPLSRGEVYLAFKAMLMNWPLGKIERAAIVFGKEAASWRQLVTLSDDVIAALDATDIDTIKIDGFIHEGRSILKTLDDEKALAGFEQVINDLEAYYLNNDFRDKKHKLSEFKKQNERLRREYAATSVDFEKILNHMVFKIKGINQKKKDDESIKIIDQEIANLSEFLRHETSIFLAGCAKISRTDLHILRQYYDLCFDDAKIKALLAGHEDKSMRFFDSLFSTLDYYMAQSDLTDQAIMTIRSIMEQSDNGIKKAESSSKLEDSPVESGLFKNPFNNFKYREACLIVLTGAVSNIGKVPWPLVGRKTWSLLSNSTLPLTVMGDHFADIVVTIISFFEKNTDYLTPENRALFNFYKRKEVFLDKMASLQSDENHKMHMEVLKKDTERITQETKRIREETEQREQRMIKELSEAEKVRLEHKKMLIALKKKLAARIGDKAS